jgi:RNA polymerase sigma factor (sigma-70 family)
MALRTQKEINNIVDNLFRREAGRITSILTNIFGLHNLEMTEDVVQDTLIKALQQWSFKGVPENPSAWLFKAAKNKAIDILRREPAGHKYFSGKLVDSEWSLRGNVNEFFSENEIKDGQLRMIFACCHPDLPGEAQTALALKNLCGFSIKEIAKAYLTNEAVISKRLTRAKEKFRDGSIKLEIPTGEKLGSRLSRVLTTLYLLFNEGYNSSDKNTLIKEDLIEEAIRLCEILADHPVTSKSEIHALLALMFFHYARTPARIDKSGNIVLLDQQERNLWDRNLIAKGIEHFNKSSDGYRMSEYHLEAGIAYFYTTAEAFEMTDWKRILFLYDLLYNIKRSPVVALNRAVVISMLEGPAAGIDAINKIEKNDTLEEYYLYHSVLADLYLKNSNTEEAKNHLQKAILLTPSEAEKKLLREKLENA